MAVPCIMSTLPSNGLGREIRKSQTSPEQLAGSSGTRGVTPSCLLGSGDWCTIGAAHLVRELFVQQFHESCLIVRSKVPSLPGWGWETIQVEIRRRLPGCESCIKNSETGHLMHLGYSLSSMTIHTPLLPDFTRPRMKFC